MGRVTIQTIAERAGVSRGTVDRVLHDRPNVNPTVREHVQQIVRQLGYCEAKGETVIRHIGVLLPGSEWFNRDLKQKWLSGVREAARSIEPLGFVVDLVECETDLPSEAEEKIRDMRSRGIDALSLCAKSSTSLCGLLRELSREGVPVVTYNSDLPDSGRVCLVGQNAYMSGRVAADLIVKYLQPQEKVLVVAGNLEINAHQQRVQGFIDKCKDAGMNGGQLITVESFNDYVLTYEKVRAALEREPEIHAVYMANESIAACVESVARSDRMDGMMIVGNDLTAVSRRLLQEGTVDFIIDQDMYEQGSQPVLLLKELLLSPDLRIPEFQFTNTDIINTENAR